MSSNGEEQGGPAGLGGALSPTLQAQAPDRHSGLLRGQGMFQKSATSAAEPKPLGGRFARELVDERGNQAGIIGLISWIGGGVACR